MSLLHDRATVLAYKRQELSSILVDRRLKLRDLYALQDITHALELIDLPPNYAHDFLLSNDLTIGRKFDESSLPSTHLVSESESPTTTDNATVSNDNVSHVAAPVASSDPTSSHAMTTVHRAVPTPLTSTTGSYHGHQPLKTPDASFVGPEHSRQGVASYLDKRDIGLDAQTQGDDRLVDPQDVIPMSAEDKANLSDSSLPRSRSPRRATTIHLPSEAVQKERLRQRDNNLKHEPLQSAAISSAQVDEQHKESVDANTIIRDTPNALSGKLSSPSGVPGAVSIERNASPVPPTSGVHATLPAERQGHGLEEHDQILSAQRDLVRNEILDSPEDVDAQLQLEVEQAARSSIPQNQSAAHVEIAPAETITESPAQLVEATRDDQEALKNAAPLSSSMKTVAEAAAPDEVAATQNSDAAQPMDVDRPDDSRPIQLEDTTTVSRQISLAAEPPVRPPITHERTNPVTDAKAVAPPPIFERRNTRISSGAMRHRSVSEILGEVPKPSQVSTSSSRSNSQVGDTVGQAAKNRSITDRARDKERSKMSTVVFAKKSNSRSVTKHSSSTHTKDQMANGLEYFMPLVQAQVYTATRGIRPMDDMILSAHKTMTTSSAYVPFHDHQTTKVLKRIFALQREDKWSFRQPVRAPEPTRPTAMWDELLKEMKWMRTDFRQERKWKMALAKNLAYACAEWVEADLEDRKALQVKAIAPPQHLDSTRTDGTPDLTSSPGNASSLQDFEDEISTSMLDVVAPTAIFSLHDDELVFGLIRGSSAVEKVLEELPMYGVPLTVPQAELPTSEVDPDISWKKEAMPLNRFVEGKIVLRQNSLPLKRSRFVYEEESEEDEDDINDTTTFSSPSIEVALFNPDNKHIRDRIQASHQFRPPSENLMPAQNFFENRSRSLWLGSEDDQLKAMVREYSYNWQLISSVLSTKSLFTSGADRRTPWECFERWITLEGLPAEMSKTHYFRAYYHRLAQAEKTLVQQNQLAQQAAANAQSAGSSAPVPTLNRRTTTVSQSVERKRNNKHVTLIEAMRKLAKRREATLAKQAHAQSHANVKKENATSTSSINIQRTPQEFSKIKHDREIQYQERAHTQRQMVQQQEQLRRQQMQARNGQIPHPNMQNQHLQHQQHAQQHQQQYNTSNNGGQISRVQQGHPLSSQQQQQAVRMNNMALPAQSSHGSMPPPAHGSLQTPHLNGHFGGNQMPMKPPQAQMQNLQNMHAMPNMPNNQRMQGVHPQQQRLPVNSPELAMQMQARSISEQQRAAIAQQQQTQQQQQHQGHVNRPGLQSHHAGNNMRPPPTSNGSGQQAYMQNNPSLIQASSHPNANGSTAPHANGYNMSQVNQTGSPRTQQRPPSASQHPVSVKPMLSVSVSNIEAQYRALNPNATTEQVQKHVRDTVSASTNPRNHAMMAAAGVTTNPQLYAQMLRAQQLEQAPRQAQEQQALPQHGSNSQSMQKPAQTQQHRIATPVQQQAQPQPQPPSQASPHPSVTPQAQSQVHGPNGSQLQRTGSAGVENGNMNGNGNGNANGKSN